MRSAMILLCGVLACKGEAPATDPAVPDAGEPDAGEPDAAPPDRAGVAVIDITPVIEETFTDINGDYEFDGCRFDPTGTEDGCDEPFDDVDGDGEFDALFIGGFGPLRPALEIHDPIEVRALVLERGDERLALVSLDLVGLGVDRTIQARERLAEQGWDPSRIIIASSHNHAGPDVRGLWGNPEPGAIWSGSDPAYNGRVTDAIVDAVEIATDSLEEVQIRMGAVHLRDRSEYFNGRHFGGKNPTDKMHGLMNDIRDPVIVSDQVFALQAKRDDGTSLAVLVNQSGHPEVTGEEHNTISSDWVHHMRVRLESKLGGRAMFLPECLGGMMSALGGHVPLVDDKGDWRTGEDGEPIFSDVESREVAEAVGVHVADAAIAALEAGEDVELDPFVVQMAPIYTPVDNAAFRLLFALDLFDIDPSLVVTDKALCPEYSETDTLNPGCVPNQTWRVRLGPASFLTAPGELLPEIFWGLPEEDPRWATESADPTLRGGGDRDSAFFPQHPPECDTVTFAECADEIDLDGCNCRKLHAWPYDIGLGSAPPLIDLLEGKYRFLVGNAGDHLGYIIPATDFNTKVGFLEDFSPGDHYEETVSISAKMAARLLAAQLTLE